MRRIAFVFILILHAAVSGLYSQSSGPRDIILLLDTSAGSGNTGTGALYEEISGYITRGFLREHLRVGNTFHLIPFSDRPFLDISRRITSRGDAETIIGRMFLHYPLHPRADIPAALSFAETYVSSLPERPKKIVVVSANSMTDGVTGRFEETRARLARLDTALEFVQITPGRTPVRTAPVVTPSVVTLPVVTPPVVTTAVHEDLLQIEHESAAMPFLFEPLPDPTLYALEEDLNFAETVPPEQTLQEPEPSAMPVPPPTVVPAATPVTPAKPASKPTGTAFTRTRAILTLSQICWLLSLLIPAFIFAVFSRKLNSPGQATTGTGGLLVINLYVEDQSTYIGRRNMHALKPGCTYTVGGKDSDFLIFLVKVPPHIAKVRTDGKTVTFTPLLHQYFPNLGSAELKDCVGKTIRVISDKNYQLKIRFDVLETGRIKKFP